MYEESLLCIDSDSSLLRTISSLIIIGSSGWLSHLNSLSAQFLILRAALQFDLEKIFKCLSWGLCKNLIIRGEYFKFTSFSIKILDDVEVEEDSGDEWFIEQNISESIDNINMNNKFKYGFALTKSNVFSKLSVFA